MRAVLLFAVVAAAVAAAQGAAPEDDRPVPIAQEAAADLLEFDPPLLKLQETRDAPTTMRVRMRRQPPRDATLYLESGNLKFSMCAVKFARASYNTWQTIDVRGLPYFTDADRARQEAVRLRLSCPNGNGRGVNGWHGRNWTYPVERPVVKGATCVSAGDPHITTFDGRYYDFQGLGCFYLLRSPSLVVQTMTDHWVNGATVSVATAIRYGRAHYIVDAREADESKRLVKLAEGPGVDITCSKDNKEFRFKFPDGSAVTITYHAAQPRNYLNHQIDVPACARGRTQGLCGTYTGNKDDDWMSANAAAVATDVNVFGNSWKVPADDDIFICKAGCRAATAPAHIKPCDQCRIPTSLSGAGVYRDVSDDYAPWNGPRSTYNGRRPNWSAPSPRVAVDPAMRARAERACRDAFNLPDAHRVLPADLYVRACIADCVLTGTLDTIEAKKAAYLNRVYTMVRPVMALAAQVPAQRSGYARSNEVAKCRSAAQVLGLGDGNCPRSCSGNGSCRKSGCVCRRGFTGVACQIRLSAYGRPTTTPPHAVDHNDEGRGAYSRRPQYADDDFDGDMYDGDMFDGDMYDDERPRPRPMPRPMPRFNATPQRRPAFAQPQSFEDDVDELFEDDEEF